MDSTLNSCICHHGFLQTRSIPHKHRNLPATHSSLLLYMGSHHIPYKLEVKKIYIQLSHMYILECRRLGISIYTFLYAVEFGHVQHFTFTQS